MNRVPFFPIALLCVLIPGAAISARCDPQPALLADRHAKRADHESSGPGAPVTRGRDGDKRHTAGRRAGSESRTGESLPLVQFTYSPAKGLERRPGICRRDPSDIIRVGRRYYVWYTKVERRNTVAGRHGYPSGYQGSVWCAVSRDAGHSWRELGEAIPKGPAEAFDCTAVFTPNIFVFRKTYYLYYTAVGPGFDNGPYADRNRTAIGVARADSPEGPWHKLHSNPVLSSTKDPRRFDSYRVDDACLISREHEVWLYYKGRQWKNTPAHTRMGVAAALRPEGPFRRLNSGRCVQDSGHEVLVWPHGRSVMSLVSATGPHGRTLQRASDGLSFEIVARLPENYPKAPGLFRPDLADPPDPAEKATWGISMATAGGDPHLVRFTMVVPKRAIADP